MNSEKHYWNSQTDLLSIVLISHNLMHILYLVQRVNSIGCLGQQVSQK